MESNSMLKKNWLEEKHRAVYIPARLSAGVSIDFAAKKNRSEGEVSFSFCFVSSHALSLT